MGKKKKERNENDIIVKEGIISKLFNKQMEIYVDGEKNVCMIPNTYMISKNAVSVGDFVKVSCRENGQYRLEEIKKRKAEVYRGNRKTLDESILIASNVDQMLVIITAEYCVNQTGYVEEALIAALRADIPVSLYISKCDAVNEQAKEIVLKNSAVYKSQVDYLFLGDAAHLDEKLLNWLAGKTTVFVGDRACGKSTLVKSIERRGNTQELGRITSTNAVEMHILNDYRIIDTPGVREWALRNIKEEELGTVYPEINTYKQKCVFRNCSHTHEEDCGVIEAVKDKKIRRERLLGYQKLRGVVSVEQPKIDYRHQACEESFVCKNCGKMIVPEGAGSQHRNHCPYCLCSLHVDNDPGDRASFCKGIMAPIGVWVRNDGEWAIIHRCKSCGELSSNRIAADDSPMLLMSIAVKPLSRPPFPLDNLLDF